jgi:hypothetical protein
MTVIAHVGGMPIEETLALYGPALLLALWAASASLGARLRRLSRRRRARGQAARARSRRTRMTGQRVSRSRATTRSIRRGAGRRGTQIYAHYAPSAQEVAMVNSAFADEPEPTGSNSGSNLSETG